jgi:hypothetical protein
MLVIDSEKYLGSDFVFGDTGENFSGRAVK